MREKRLRAWIGLGLIAAHLITIVVLLGFYSVGGFHFDEMTTAVGLLSPMFLAYTSVITSYFTKHPHQTKDEGPAMASAFVALSVATPLLFSLLVIVSTILKGTNLAFGSFEEYKGTLLGLEAVFAAYLGRLVPVLFGPALSAPPLSLYEGAPPEH
jgi:hypothetical protein